jgi:multidrug efflux pump subunit AcrA (membrane-fusion protein)
MDITFFRSRKFIIPGTIIIIALGIIAVILYIRANSSPSTQTATTTAQEVGVQTVKDSQVYNQTIEYAAQVLSDQEAQLFAKTTGSVTSANFNPGDKVTIGQELIKIDDVNSNSSFSQAGFSAGQVKQAIIGVQQAEAAYNLAKQNYQNVLVSTGRDLKAVEIAREQAATGKDNLGTITSGSLKTAELAYETARIAAEQARLSLENRKSIAGQSEADTITAAKTTADAVANSCGTIIYGINNIAALDDNSVISINYQNNLGVLDSSTVYARRQCLCASS